ncbi:autotransporter outer membrane beta-barrel domain-containing protein [Pseudocitrobacter cyperus]|uniref:Autotransporter outer membrane beta-barrel domain-containing protein n=1 Tax=Pseudocitrobacter cyperus TaxID=3112843 RepID=A0ABV0HH81_9ENTR
MKPIPLRPNKIALFISFALMTTGSLLSGVNAAVLEAPGTLYYYGSGNPNGGRDYTNYDEVSIVTGVTAKTSPLQGWAIYLNDGSTYKFNDLTVKTTGMLSDGIHTKNGGGLVEIENYTSTTTGFSSDGINLGRELATSSAKVVINNKADIKANGMGVRANASIGSANALATIIINGQSNIETTSSGANWSGYAVYAGQDTENNTVPLGKAEIYLNGDTTITTVGSNAHGVYARAAGMVSLGNVTVSASGNNANALFASSSTSDKSATINLAKDVNLTVGTGSAIYATGSDALIRSWDVNTDSGAAGRYTVNGNIISDKGATVSLNMADGSLFTGVTDAKTATADAGTLNLSIDGISSIWNMTGDSVLNALTLDNGATLKYGTVANITTDTFSLGSDGGMIDTNGFDNSLGEVISGSGLLSKKGAGTLTLTGVNTYTGGTDVKEGTLQLDPTTTVSTVNLGSGAANIALDATLAALSDGAFTFNNALTGDGLLSASNNGDAFNFSADVGAGFTGTVALADNTFTLSGDNTSALTQATLRLDAGNVTTVGDGSLTDNHQQIGGLAFNGGTAIFNANVPADKKAISTITAAELDITGNGTVQVTVPAQFNNSQPVPDTSLPLLEQDDLGAMVQLVSASHVTGTGGAIDLVDQNGNAISDARTLGISQDGVTVAEGTYDFGLTAGTASDGLYVNYGLQQVNLLGTGAQALVLTPAAGASGAATDLGAKVIGTGDLAIVAGAGQQVSLSNGSNSYSGATDVRSGTLAMANDHVLGQTSALNLAAGTTADMGGYSQSVGALNTAAGSQMVVSGALTITDTQRAAGETAGGMIESGTLAGSGSLNIDPSVVRVNGDQSAFTGQLAVNGGSELKLNSASAFNQAQGISLTTTMDTLTFGDLSGDNAAWTSLPVGTASVAIAGQGKVQTQQGADVTLSGDNSLFAGLFQVNEDSTLQVSQAKNLGSAEVVTEGTLVFNHATDWLLANTVTGNGQVLKTGAGTLSIDSSMAGFSGTSEVASGALVVGETGSESSALGGDVKVNSGGILSGTGTVTGHVDNAGIIAAYNALTALNGYGDATSATNLTVGSLTNAGSLQLAGSAVGNTLNINGDYAGNNGTLVMNTVLGGDSSLTDKLIVAGNTSGTTNVIVNNAGGSGAKTINGIEVIEVGGSSDGEFVQSGRIVAGSYEYFLGRGDGNNTSNWYLTNTVPPTDPDPTDPDPTDPVDPTEPTDPTDPVDPGPSTHRPESGSYIANLAAANTMFSTRLHDRLGDTQYTDLLTGEEKVTSLWLRQVGGHNRFDTAKGQLKTQSNRYVVQLGGDLAQWSTNGLDRWHLGAMAGYGNSKSNTQSNVTGYRSRGQVTGYSVGLYGTWYANEADKTGTYLDSWILYNWFDNTVSGQGLASEKYDSDGITASVEGGYTFLTGTSERSTYWVQPKVQITWMDVQADNHTEANGTRVKDKSDGNLQTRLGVRAFIKGHNAIDDGKTRDFQPFVEANWIYNSKTYGVTMNNVSSYQEGTRNIGEVKVGVEGQINKNLHLWGNVAQQLGDKGYSDTQGMLGIKYAF